MFSSMFLFVCMGLEEHLLLFFSRIFSNTDTCSLPFNFSLSLFVSSANGISRIELELALIKGKFCSNYGPIQDFLRQKGFLSPSLSCLKLMLGALDHEG